jgi:uncharacterized protein YoxC
MSDKSILETVYSTTEVLHEVGLISEEVWAQVGELSRMQQEVEDIHASVLDHIHVDMVQTYMQEQQTEIEQLKRAVLVASGLLSTTDDWKHKHPDECREMLMLLGGLDDE